MGKFKVSDNAIIANPESSDRDCLGEIVTIVSDTEGCAYPYKDDKGRLWCDDESESFKGICGKQGIEPVYFKDIKEEKEMNKVLNLWFERKQQAIIEKYSKMEQDFINNNYSVVQSYDELIAQFEFDKLSCEFTDLHCKEKQDELKEIAKIREEVEAQLSLSDELKYQQEVLIRYDIIDKKTKKIKV